MALLDALNAALDTPSARRVYHTARCAYRSHHSGSLDDFLVYLKDSTRMSMDKELRGILERSSMGLREAMMLPIRFDMTYRCKRQ